MKTNCVRATIAAVLLAISVSAMAAEQVDTNLLVPAVASTNDVTKFDLEMGGSGNLVRSGAGGIAASLYANPFKAARPLWVGVSQSVNYGPATGETDLGAQWSFNVWNETWFANPGWQIGYRYGSGTRSFTTGPQFELQWYYNDSTYLYGSAGLSLAARGQGTGWYVVGVGLEF